MISNTYPSITGMFLYLKLLSSTGFCYLKFKRGYNLLCWSFWWFKEKCHSFARMSCSFWSRMFKNPVRINTGWVIIDLYVVQNMLQISIQGIISSFKFSEVNLKECMVIVISNSVCYVCRRIWLVNK